MSKFSLPSQVDVVTKADLRADLAELETKIYRALLVQTFALATIFGVIVSVVKFL